MSMNNIALYAQLNTFKECKDCMYSAPGMYVSEQKKRNEWTEEAQRGTEFRKETAVGKKLLLCWDG